MSTAPVRKLDTHDIVVEDVFPHAPSTIWKVLTTGALISRWLKMPLAGFEPVVGNRFTYKTTPAGGWDGTIYCEILEVVENRRFVHSWKGGDESNVGYGAPLDTVVTWTLAPVEAGTRLRLVHSGFVLPRNQTAFTGMGNGWRQVVRTIDAISAEETGARKPD